ncbi:MAG: hypothetical protein Q7S61_06495 [bacterium]|nr:hypothetical protein [bacterium]
MVQRVMEVAMRNRIQIEDAKNSLNADNLRGIMLNIHSHAGQEDRTGIFNNHYPEKEQLDRLGITNVALLAEVSPNNAHFLYEDIIDGQSKTGIGKPVPIVKTN